MINATMEAWQREQSFFKIRNNITHWKKNLSENNGCGDTRARKCRNFLKSKEYAGSRNQVFDFPDILRMKIIGRRN